MRPDHVVVSSPTLDDDLGLVQRVEDLAIEKLVAQARIEALATLWPCEVKTST
jgi:hypothetical protein